MKVQEKETTRLDGRGLYCHVPFCASTCDFCAFYQEKPRKDDIRRYLDGIEQELAYHDHVGRMDTFFWGGGTPGLLAPDDLERLGRTLLAAVGSPPAEWTVEMAPSAVKPEKLEVLKSLGVTRISMGVQSFQPRLLEALGRQHNLRQIHQAYDRVRAAGFDSVNLDLIFAVPGQEMSDWEGDLNKAMALEPDHLSTYCLTFEEDTALWVKLTEGGLKRSIENERMLYGRTWDLLEEGGYAQYEISNFSRPGHECRHNQSTWAMGSWLGVGPSAASQWEGRRFTNIPSLDSWLKGYVEGVPERIDTQELTPELLATDAVIFGLRMNAGIDLAQLGSRFPAYNWNLLEPLWGSLEEEGLAMRSGSAIRLTQEGRFVADGIAEWVLD